MKPACKLTVVGGGLAGCEAAWQAAARGVHVRLFEMRPRRTTPAHRTGSLAELVCSNSMRSDKDETAVGTLKNELRAMGSLVMEIAEQCRVPAGNALAVDRKRFAEAMTNAIGSHPCIEIIREEVVEIPEGATILAPGPLTSPTLASRIADLFGIEHLSFYDGIAPIVEFESLEQGTYFFADRYQEENPVAEHAPDYLNVPLTEEEYGRMVDGMINAEIAAHLPEENPAFFDGCLPIEEMARRGRDTPRFGPMKPVGLIDPETGRRPYAAIQLRKENLSGALYNIVGFQTQMTIPDQRRILGELPAFARAVFVRYGSAHRNTFLDSPRLLNRDLTAKARPTLRFAGQITGVEGYVESTACGLVAGLLASVPGLTPPPETTVIGGLMRHVTGAPGPSFQPMKANWGLVPHEGAPRREKKEFLARRSLLDLERWIAENMRGKP